MSATTQAPTKTVPETLSSARALLLQDGWHKGGLYPGSCSGPIDGGASVGYRPGMPLSLTAACRVADTGHPRVGMAQDAIDALQATLERRTGRPLGVETWQANIAALDDVLQLIDDTITYWNQQHAVVGTAS